MTSSIEQASTLVHGFLRFEPTMADIIGYAISVSMILIFLLLLATISSGSGTGRHP
jgi:hypothetical protein